MELVNYMEKVVLKKLEVVIKNFPDCCNCEECKRDIAILALNQLPPKYVSTHKGSIFAHLEEMDMQYDVIVTQEVIKAIEKVQQHPRHTAKQ